MTKKLQKEYPELRLVYNKLGRGVVNAVKAGVAEAKGEYVLILNPDTKVSPDTFTLMLDFMKKNPDVGVASCRVEFPNGELDVDCRRHFPTP